MKFIIFVIPVLILAAWNCSSSVNVSEKSEVITPALLSDYITYLASDELKGRNTPGPGLDTAAEYISRKFEAFGFSKVNGSWFQNLPLGYISLGEENHFKINKDGEEISFAIKDDFVPFEITGNNSAEGKLVFCGYGIEAPELNYNDYAGINLKGKVALILRHHPGESDSASVFNRKVNSELSSLENKTKIAASKGASAVILINDPLNHTSLRPVGFPWPSLSKIIPKDAIPLAFVENEYNNIPVIHAGEKFIDLIFGSAEELKKIQAGIDSEMKGFSREFNNINVSIRTSTNINETPARNVVGFLEGSDLKDEIIVIGAHYDHVGVKKNPKEGEDSIFNGADDNASGTAGMLAIANAFSKMNVKPSRSVLFIAFAGEERGLFGSRYYVNNPLFPLEKTIGMLNLDMIGRNGEDSLYVNAHSRSPELRIINERQNANIGLILIHRGESSVGGSDHAPFIRKGIAALFYHSGIHADYHKVSDEASLIDFSKAAKISRLAFLTAWEMANDSTRYKVTEQSTSLIY